MGGRKTQNIEHQHEYHTAYIHHRTAIKETSRLVESWYKQNAIGTQEILKKKIGV